MQVGDGADVLKMGHPAVPLHDQQRPFESAVMQLVLQSFEIPLDGRTKVTVEDRGVGTSIFAGHLRQRAGEGPVNLSMRIGFGSKRADFFFVTGVGPGMHQAHRYGVDFFVFDQPADCLHDIVPIKRHDLVALIVHAFPDADDAFARHERLGFGDPGDVLDLVVRETVDAADRTHDLGGVFESFGSDEPDPAAVMGD